jgi:hypothetical protein
LLVVILISSFLIKAVRWSDGVGVNGLVCKVAYSLRHDAEGGWRLDPPHGASKGGGDELRFPFKLGED